MAKSHDYTKERFSRQLSSVQIDAQRAAHLEADAETAKAAEAKKTAEVNDKTDDKTTH